MQKKHKRRKMLRAAAKSTDLVRHVAGSKYERYGKARYEKARLGTFGAASDVRSISVEDYEKSPANQLTSEIRNS